MQYLDPSIIMGFKGIELPDQTNLLLKGLQAQGLMGQNRLQDIQLQQGQQSLDRANALSQYYSSDAAKTDDQATRSATVMRLDPINGPKQIESFLNTQKTQADIQRMQDEIDAHHISRLASDVGAAAESGPQAVAQAIQGANYLPADRKATMLDAMRAGVRMVMAPSSRKSK